MSTSNGQTGNSSRRNSVRIDGSNSPNGQDQSNEDCTSDQDSESDRGNNLEKGENEPVTTSTETHQRTTNNPANLGNVRSRLTDTNRKRKDGSIAGQASNNDVAHTARTHPSIPNQSEITKNSDDSSHAKKNIWLFSVINSRYKIFMCCGLVMLLFRIYFAVSYKDNRYECTFNKTLALSQSRRLIKTLKDQFPSQTEDTWKKLTTLTWKVNQTCNPQWKKPLVYTLAHRAGAFNTSRCLTMKILAAARRPFIELNAKGQYSTKPDISNALKHAFTKQLNEALPSKGIAVFNDLQSLNSELADQFRIYCDNTDAPYKQAVILFHVALDETDDDVLLSTDEIYMEKEVTKVLRKSWSLMEESSFVPLSVRILQNIVIINAEEGPNGC